jgi:hypothetical protein
MTMTSITAGKTMAATAIVGHIKHEHNKHGKGTPKACLYLYFAFLYDHYYYCAIRATKTNSTTQQQVAKPARACFKPTQAENQSIQRADSYCLEYWMAGFQSLRPILPRRFERSVCLRSLVGDIESYRRDKLDSYWLSKIGHL